MVSVSLEIFIIDFLLYWELLKLAKGHYGGPSLNKLERLIFFTYLVYS